MRGDIAVNFKSVSKYYSSYQTKYGFKHFLLNLPKYIKRKSEKIWVLRRVTFSIYKREAVAFIGRNGAGKSTLLALIAGIVKPNEGEVSTSGRIVPLLELGTGFHPDLTGLENIVLNGVLLGMRKKEVENKIDSIVEFSELGDFIYQPVRIYSSGMIARLGFSIAVHANPDILLVDEVLSVGDVGFQKKCIDKILELKSEGVTIVFVSHNMEQVKLLCNRAFLLENGGVREIDLASL